MSLHHYQASREIVEEKSRRGWPFYSLIMAAMREADTGNRQLLKAGWPEVWEDLLARYEAPGGRLETDEPEHLKPERTAE